MDSEAGIFSMTFDGSGSRLITTDADKTIKIFKEDDTAVSLEHNPIHFHKGCQGSWVMEKIIFFLQTEETHPISWKPDILKRRRY